MVACIMLMVGMGVLMGSPVPVGDTGEPGNSSLPSTRASPGDDVHGSGQHAASGLESSPALESSLSTSGGLPPPPLRSLPSTAFAEAMSRPPEATPVTRLPLDTQELMPDGLPSSALRCTLDGGVFTCGGCRTSADCPPGRACLPHREMRRFECLESECEEDVHCFPGFVCRALNRGDTTTPPIRRCVPNGLRREGEPCDPEPVSPRGTCQEGLRCALGVCGTPCLPEEPRSCPTDHVCRKGSDGPACIPDCRRRGCPEGQRCKQLDEAEHRCLRVDHGSCPETPCPECNRGINRGRGVFWCGRTCDPRLAGSCPEGEVCGTRAGLSTCYPRCDPSDSDSCGDGFECASGSYDLSFWGCMPTYGP
jgi:hypothetical protein